MKQKGNFAFIDSQNLNMGTKKAGWNMDWRKSYDNFIAGKSGHLAE